MTLSSREFCILEHRVLTVKDSLLWLVYKSAFFKYEKEKELKSEEE